MALQAEIIKASLYRARSLQQALLRVWRRESAGLGEHKTCPGAGRSSNLRMEKVN